MVNEVVCILVIKDPDVEKDVRDHASSLGLSIDSESLKDGEIIFKGDAQSICLLGAYNSTKGYDLKVVLPEFDRGNDIIKNLK